MQNNFKLSIDEINKNGCFSKKVFKHCKNLEELIEVVEFLSQKNRCKAFEYKNLVIPKEGVIVALHPTLMQWGEITIVNFNVKRYNSYILSGYKSI